MIHLKYWVFACLSFTTTFVTAQNFGYALTKDSTTYTALTNASSVSTGENWNSKSFPLHLPFQFNFCGSTSDSLTIEGNGFIVFDKVKELSIVAFNNFRSNKDTNQSYVSSISYVNTGSQGNRITKIEFKNLSQNKLSSDDYLNYQVWIYENGNKVEIHTGANSYSDKEDFSSLMGIINRNMDTDTKAYLVSGNPSSPSGQAISGDSELVYVNNIPNGGIVYTLTPTF